jgi:hypothetical protein
MFSLPSRSLAEMFSAVACPDAFGIKSQCTVEGSQALTDFLTGQTAESQMAPPHLPEINRSTD